MYTLLIDYNNNGDEFEIDDIDLHNIVNKLNLTRVTVTMVMMENKDNDNSVLIDSNI